MLVRTTTCPLAWKSLMHFSSVAMRRIYANSVIFLLVVAAFCHSYHKHLPVEDVVSLYPESDPTNPPIAAPTCPPRAAPTALKLFFSNTVFLNVC
ncbi:unnamed protein product [Gongylonema pulchrum]|uniref:Secreted protein n=1 Tax=Gongylonema pulchrum TaxID=637853 RepID=A0A183DI56_9BILA|nr:unnamed protein product [Gongylonema pulchrum]